MREDRILGWDFGGEIPIDEVTLQRSSMDTFWLQNDVTCLLMGPGQNFGTRQSRYCG
jgi:hypothetical protein